MPTFSLPELSAEKFADGTAITPGAECHPVLLVVDSNGKAVRFDGNQITVPDATTSFSAHGGAAPEVTGPGSGGSG